MRRRVEQKKVVGIEEKKTVEVEMYTKTRLLTMKNLHHIIQNQIHQLVMTFQCPRNCSPQSASQSTYQPPMNLIFHLPPTTFAHLLRKEKGHTGRGRGWIE